MGATPGGTVRYQFTATEPGTYLYHSGTRPDLQVEMGLVGAIIVRPEGFDPMMPMGRKAYATMDSMYDEEYLFLLTEMDPLIHRLVERGFTGIYHLTNGTLAQWLDEEGAADLAALARHAQREQGREGFLLPPQSSAHSRRPWLGLRQTM